MNKAIILVGLPGSGKSSWCKKFLASQTDEYVIISSDDLVDAWAAEHGLTYDEAFKICPNFEKTINYAFREAMKSGKNIIVDRTCMSVKARRKWLSELTDSYEAEAVVFVVDDVELKRRLEARKAAIGKSIPEFVLKSMQNRYQAPSKEEGFVKITYVRA